jgi:octaprenyl-diphosphate synthase
LKDLKRKILEGVNSDLAAIEEALKKNLNPYLELVSDIAGHILFSGGKRLRPLLVVLGARMCGYRGDMGTTSSVIFEYLHAATLVHDDIIDGASMRRGEPVAHSIWGNPAAVLVGDFLLARSISLSARTRDARIISVVADITENMSQGEIHQLMKRGDFTLSEEEYYEVIRRKTAVLFRGACRVSALLADAPPLLEKALADYGFHMGMAFQMIDDVLDYTPDTRVWGKGAGADIREGKLTLPVIAALKSAGDGDRRQIENMISRQDFSDQDFQDFVDLLERYDGIAYTRRRAADHVQQAKEAIMTFEPSETREILLDVADYALVRKV